jgi:flagellar basal-body rod modification protein FlgD
MATSSMGPLTGPTIDNMISGPSAQSNKANSSDVTKEGFMKLLVAQIKHQNPLSPADGVQFLSQLAQFSELEQLVNLNSTLSSVEKAVTTPATPEPDKTV